MNRYKTLTYVVFPLIVVSILGFYYATLLSLQKNVRSQVWYLDLISKTKYQIIESQSNVARWETNPQEIDMHSSFYMDFLALKKKYKNCVQKTDEFNDAEYIDNVSINRLLHKSANRFDAYFEVLTKWVNFSTVEARRYKSIEERGIVNNTQDEYIKQLDREKSNLFKNLDDLQVELVAYYDELVYTMRIVMFIWILAAATTILLAITAINRNKKKYSRLREEYLEKEVLHKGQMDELSVFIDHIAKNNFDVELSVATQHSTFAKSLLLLKEKLKTAAEEFELQKIETEKRNWATHGLTRFAEILRENSSDLHEMSYKVVSNLVKYLNANQGGLFMLTTNLHTSHRYLELTASYAFERRKYIVKEIEIGEGLVGMSILEGKSICLHEMPEGYLSIKSGLGEAAPRSLIIVPLKLNDEYYGVVEIASFNPFEPYQIEFVEKLGESIAATIASVRTTIQTSKLLEEAKQQTERLEQVEEEMRQNVEELMATQEELSRKDKVQKDEIERLTLAEAVRIKDLESKMEALNRMQSDFAKSETEYRSTIDGLTDRNESLESKLNSYKLKFGEI